MSDPIGKQNWPVVPADAVSRQPYRLYTTRHGDSLSGLAKRFLGDTDRWREIYAVNQDKMAHPRDVAVGMQLRIPLPGPPAGQAGPGPAPPKPECGGPALDTADRVCVRTYKVHRGESLSAIAGKLWHDQDRWVALYQANIDKIPDPEAIEPGAKLKVPSDEEIKTLKADPLAEVQQRRPHGQDVIMMARAIMAEARGESLQCKMAIATAILNYATGNAISIPKLVRSSYLSSNLDGNAKYYTMPIKDMRDEGWEDALTAARDAFDKTSVGRQLIGDRDHFYDDSIPMPPWGNKDTTVKIGSMVFLDAK